VVRTNCNENVCPTSDCACALRPDAERLVLVVLVLDVGAAIVEVEVLVDVRVPDDVRGLSVDVDVLMTGLVDLFQPDDGGPTALEEDEVDDEEDDDDDDEVDGAGRS
jgi:hypothetical protein